MTTHNTPSPLWGRRKVEGLREYETPPPVKVIKPNGEVIIEPPIYWSTIADKKHVKDS
jgi:hypothetical protein